QRLWRPMENLLSVTSALSSGDLDRRAIIVRNDEIGSISEGVNQVADNMQYLINNLERIVEERTETLYQTNKELEGSRRELKTLLDSTAEGIFGIDLDGNCTFLNKAALRLLGYERQELLLGENMHRMVHHDEQDDLDCTPETCPIISSVRTGKGYDSDNDVFYTADGNRIDVAFHSYPRIIDGKIVGGVITFLDITQKKERENQIEYLSSHDTLTGLFNRGSLDFFYSDLSTERHLPLSVIFGDLNGLKMTNDVFGHLAGDSLLAGAARILTDSIRKVDVAARIGGDEFLILLPNTGKKEVMEVIRRIKRGFQGKKLDAVNYSMALGGATRETVNESIETLIAIAEEEMYKDKARSKKETDAATIATILETLSHKKYNNWNRSEQAQTLC
ncbi:MAG: diguanylate cyclase, partial [Sphaerochaetaceae bacterium]|nr:diguanylate cyclase [Sphaerochaetaceae bacterium]